MKWEMGAIRAFFSKKYNCLKCDMYCVKHKVNHPQTITLTVCEFSRAVFKASLYETTWNRTGFQTPHVQRLFFILVSTVMITVLMHWQNFMAFLKNKHLSWVVFLYIWMSDVIVECFSVGKIWTQLNVQRRSAHIERPMTPVPGVSLFACWLFLSVCLAVFLFSNSSETAMAKEWFFTLYFAT